MPPDQSEIYGGLNELILKPEPIVSIVGRGRTGKTHLAGRIYSVHVYSGIYQQILLFDPYGQIDTEYGFQNLDQYLAALEAATTENGARPEPDRRRILALIDEADLIYDAWRRKDDYKEYLLRYNRHMKTDLILTFRNIPKKDILLFSNIVILFQHYNMELENFTKQAGFSLDARTFPPRFFKILKL